MAIKIKVPFSKSKQRYYVDYYIQGKRCRKFFRFESSARDFKRGELFRKESPDSILPLPFLECSQRFLASQTFMQAKTHYKREKTRFAQLAEMLPERMMHEYTVADMEAFKRLRLLGDPAKGIASVGEKTINNDLLSLGSLFKWAVQNKHAEIRPTAGLLINRPRPKKIRKARSQEEIQAVVSNLCKCHKNEVLLIANLGLRGGEASQLEYPKHFDFEHHVIDFKWEDGVDIKGRADRMIPMNDWVENFAKTLEPGKVLKTRYYVLYNHFKKACKKAGVDMTVHELRHTYATEIQNNGVDPKTAQKMLGHQSIETTMKYSHTPRERLAMVRNAVTFQCHDIQPKRDEVVRCETVQDENPVTIQIIGELQAIEKVRERGVETVNNLSNPTIPRANFSVGHETVPRDSTALDSLIQGLKVL